MTLISAMTSSLQKAVKEVPSMRFAFAAVGLGAAVGLIALFTGGVENAPLMIALVLGVMVVLVVFSIAVANASSIAAKPAEFLIWSMSILFVVALGTVFFSVVTGKLPGVQSLLGLSVPEAAAVVTIPPTSPPPDDTIIRKIYESLNLSRDQEAVRLVDTALQKTPNHEATFAAGKVLADGAASKAISYFESAAQQGSRKAVCEIVRLKGGISGGDICEEQYIEAIDREGAKTWRERIDLNWALAGRADDVDYKRGIEALMKDGRSGDYEAAFLAVIAMKDRLPRDEKFTSYADEILDKADGADGKRPPMAKWFVYRLTGEGLFQNRRDSALDDAADAGDIQAIAEKAVIIARYDPDQASHLFDQLIEVGGFQPLTIAHDFYRCEAPRGIANDEDADRAKQRLKLIYAENEFSVEKRCKDKVAGTRRNEEERRQLLADQVFGSEM